MLRTMLIHQQGSGFGEFAVLAATNKIRSCAAVALDEDSTLLYLHADTYNAVLRQHHFRSTQLNSSIALLQELPLFKQLSQSTLTALAYTIKSQTYSRNEVVVSSGDLINNMFLIASGDVKVHAATAPNVASTDSADSATSVSVRKRLPSVAVAVMGRGKLIGEAEVFQDSRQFDFCYRVSSSIAELLAIPATVFREAISANHLKGSPVYKAIEATHLQKKIVLDERLKTALGMVKSPQTETKTKEFKSKNDLGTPYPMHHRPHRPFQYSSPPLSL